MDSGLFAAYAAILRDLSESQLFEEIERPARLLIDSESAAGKRVDVVYAPFDHVNIDAKIVIVGLTPGRQQMRNAIIEAKRQIGAGLSEVEALAAAKVFASFSGPMRANLVAMLDNIGVNRLLGLASVQSLWSGDAGRAHFTSALRYPVFTDGANYSGAPSMLTTPILRRHLMQWFAAEMSALREALFVPLGPKVGAALEVVAGEIGIDRRRVLAGIPHPSGANAERIAFFLGRKQRELLSAKVDPDRLIADRAMLESKILALSSA